MKRILPCFLCICLLLAACSSLQSIDEESQQVMQDQIGFNSKVAVSNGIQIIAKRPYIKRGEIGVLALKCAPNATCQIVAEYKISGKEYRVTRDMVAGKDGSVLCTWKVDKNTDVGSYEIVVTSGGNRIVTTYIVQ